ncbi:hypothetical protein ACOT81_46240 [Streptomyces sp. WI04-05B]|uniref:hypothetical protein n=1 Tax=Streptomyces TaxID=1883 RepID=UPI0029BDC3EC|nr:MULTISPECIES: hypothetical protein [unclassified Streptomyces]MDX2546552.1 hypothetical protein [Streptomyces sp. WI04-05B]MDX2587816.1 hypothetical protein [Streptomyces sp. WI04-05A]MDX3751586.1 hypothetical protein [Streptomyces sp. AK08-02]
MTTDQPHQPAPRTRTAMAMATAAAASDPLPVFVPGALLAGEDETDSTEPHIVRGID